MSTVAERLGTPRLHLRRTTSTNDRARELAARGAAHGTLVTAGEQSAGRGRQGRTWTAPAGRALLCSLVIRDPPRLLPLAAGVAVAELAGEVAELAGQDALVKWPNDVLLGGRKVAGILVEGRPQERWAVLGIGVNVALRAEDLPPELRDTAATLGLEYDAIEPILARLLELLERWIPADRGLVLEAVRERDALLGKHVRWAGGDGLGAGIDQAGRLLVDTDAGRVELEAGEVHLA
jgi:BirA family transcriptional regulator, biotin operon repressor / biotin---[acetyl-CoA-carboxylase] ligase